MAVASLSSQEQTPFKYISGSLSAHMEGPPGHTQGVTLQPVFIPRQHSGLSRDASMQSGSMSSSTLGPSASADWAYLLRNAAALRNGSLSGADAAQLAAQLAATSSQLDLHGRATSPQVMTSPGSFLVASAPLQMMQQQNTSNSASGLFGSNSMVGLDALHQLSAEALASATDPSNSFAMMPNGTLNSTLSGMSSMNADGTVQTLYSSNEAVAAAAAAAAARATATQSILQQQAAVAANNANFVNSLGHAGLAGLGNSLNMNSLMMNQQQLEESLSGSLFGPGAGAASASPKPVVASLYIKNLPVDADKLFLYEKFSPYGAILSVKVLNDPQSGQCRGVGFVNFAEHTSAVRSIQALHGTKLGDKLLHVSLQTPRLRITAMGGM